AALGSNWNTMVKLAQHANVAAITDSFRSIAVTPHKGLFLRAYLALFPSNGIPHQWSPPAGTPVTLLHDARPTCCMQNFASNSRVVAALNALITHEGWPTARMARVALGSRRSSAPIADH
ncbi:MAG: hypothetical protein L0Y42_07860, partial [Phycisphaerales bacterium]|nr:hypothetical protein [Phycisphaerales bacterium]